MKEYPKITIIQQPNRYTCYPTCVSILTGIPLEKLLESLGHNGSDNNGFNYEEIAVSLLGFGWSIIIISNYDFDSFISCLKKENLYYRMILSLKNNNKYHAVAWDGKSDFIIDPMNSSFTKLAKIKNKISTIEVILPIENRKINFLDLDIYPKFRNIRDDNFI